MTVLAPFELHRAHSVAEASALLAEHGDDAVVYAGGTELLLLMKLGFAAYGHLVDVKPIAELGGIAVADGSLRIGGAVTHRAIERSPMVAAGWPSLARMESRLANIRVRSVGTLGGNLSFADPHSDPATFLLAADARVVLGAGEERRAIPIGAFVRGPYETALGPGELLVAVEVPPVPAGSAMEHLRFAFHERPAATVSCFVRVSNGRLEEARIAVGSVGIVPVRVPEGEGMLAGTKVGRARARAARRGGFGGSQGIGSGHRLEWLGRVQAEPGPGAGGSVPPPCDRRGFGTRCRGVIRAMIVLFAVIVVIAAGAATALPLTTSCASSVSDQVCHDTVTAALQRGMPAFHPLILAAHVEPGPAALGQAGHRATVTFDLLGVPGATSVRLFSDIGGHWGGAVDRGAPELALWSLVAALVGIGLGLAALRALQGVRSTLVASRASNTR